MKKLELYVCEKCGTQYTSKAQCEQCEKGHKTGLTITDARYLPYTRDETGMPVAIDVTACGKVYRYKR